MEISLLPVMPGTISAKDKAKLAKAGVIVIEHEKPEQLRLLRPMVDLDVSDMLACAMRALCDGSTASASVQALFTRHIGAALEKKAKP